MDYIDYEEQHIDRCGRFGMLRGRVSSDELKGRGIDEGWRNLCIGFDGAYSSYCSSGV